MPRFQVVARDRPGLLAGDGDAGVEPLQVSSVNDANTGSSAAAISGCSLQHRLPHHRRRRIDDLRALVVAQRVRPSAASSPSVP